MKHSRISLLERAAEVYDFAAALRARGGAPEEPAPAPEPEAPEAPMPEAEAEEPVLDLSLSEAAPAAPAAPTEPLRARAAPAPVPTDAAPIDRVALAEGGFIVPEAAATSLAEEFRLIKRRLLAGMDRLGTLPEEKRRSVLISSAQPKEGKSFCAVNLALSLAGEREHDVLLVDGDFSKPDVPAILGLPAGPGLVDALADPNADPEAFIIHTDVPGLSVLPAGRKQNNVPELLASDRTREVLARLIAANSRRIILFDSPPALMASPATVLAALVGQTLVVVRADQTTEADLRETIGVLSGCDHVALMLNAATIGASGRKYGAYESYGHAD